MKRDHPDYVAEPEAESGRQGTQMLLRASQNSTPDPASNQNEARKSGANSRKNQAKGHLGTRKPRRTKYYALPHDTAAQGTGLPSTVNQVREDVLQLTESGKVEAESPRSQSLVNNRAEQELTGIPAQKTEAESPQSQAREKFLEMSTKNLTKTRDAESAQSQARKNRETESAQSQARKKFLEMTKLLK